MKHYMDIENLREIDVDLGDEMIRKSNCEAFRPGNHITISEKIDGSCASALFNHKTGEFEAYSRNKQLDPVNTLNGFYNLVQTFDKLAFPEGMIVFGEWTGARNKIVYDLEKTKKWYVFDIYNAYTQTYMPWRSVKLWCDAYGFEYAYMLYDGPFISWDHVRSFMSTPHYGSRIEGVVVKRQDFNPELEPRTPYYLKLVNEDFRESKKVGKPKALDPEIEKAKELASQYAEQIVTRNRVEKMLTKLRDDGILEAELTPQSMKTVAKNLPKRIYMDCMKEEPEIVMAMGEYGGKAINAATMRIAREIILS